MFGIFIIALIIYAVVQHRKRSRLRWMKRGGGVNILTEDIMSNFGEMAAYGETRVCLEALEPAPDGATRVRDLQMT